MPHPHPHLLDHMCYHLLWCLHCPDVGSGVDCLLVDLAQNVGPDGYTLDHSLFYQPSNFQPEIFSTFSSHLFFSLLSSFFFFNSHCIPHHKSELLQIPALFVLFGSLPPSVDSIPCAPRVLPFKWRLLVQLSFSKRLGAPLRYCPAFWFRSPVILLLLSLFLCGSPCLAVFSCSKVLILLASLLCLSHALSSFISYFLGSFLPPKGRSDFALFPFPRSSTVMSSSSSASSSSPSSSSSSHGGTS